MSWLQKRAKKRKRLWAAPLIVAFVLGCQREMKVLNLSQAPISTSGAASGATSGNPAAESTHAAGDSSISSPGSSSGSTVGSSASGLGGTYTLQRYQCVSATGELNPIYTVGSLGTQSETLSLTDHHLRDVVGFSMGCTVVLDYDVVFISDSEIKLTHRQHSVLYLERPDTAGNCAQATPKVAQFSDEFTFPYIHTDQRLALKLKDSATNPYCKTNESLQTVYVRN